MRPVVRSYSKKSVPVAATGVFDADDDQYGEPDSPAGDPGEL